MLLKRVIVLVLTPLILEECLKSRISSICFIFTDFGIFSTVKIETI